MKDILVLIHDDEGQEARLQAALDVTRALKGHLTCLDVTTMLPVVSDCYGVSGGALLLDLEREAEAANRAKIEPRLGAEDVAWSWRETTDYVAPALEDAANLADLIVVNLAFAELPEPDLRALAASLPVKARRPVLAVPNEPLGFNAAGSALIAWDGSREASDALEGAAPLLQLADKVTILEVDDGSVAAPAEDAAAYLSRHDIHPVIVRKSGRSAASEILNSASCGPYDYLVMGAFGHSRISEALFGGVTRQLLEDCPIPILLIH